MYKIEFSPPKPPPKPSQQQSKWFTVEVPCSPEENNADVKPVLILKPFSAVPHISFNKVKVGSVKSCVLYIQNPLDKCQVVRVEKFPSDKGFSIEKNEISVEPNEEKAVTIVWAPEKSQSCRETIAFKSSSGCKIHVYVIGNAYSPKRATHKVISAKNKKLPRKKCSPNIKKIHNNVEKYLFNPQNKGEDKENLGTLHSNSVSFLNLTENSNFKFLSTPEPTIPFCLKTAAAFPDSPIRRQTYTINSMLLHGRESEILPFRPKESLGHTKIENTFRKSQVPFTLAHSTHMQNSFHLEANVTHSSARALCTKDNLNDSLENAKFKNKTEPFVNLHDSLSESEGKYESMSLNTTKDIKDSVKTYDIASKHIYFGVTPQPKSDQNPVFANSSIYVNGNLNNALSSYERKAIAHSAPVAFRNWQSNYSEFSGLDVLDLLKSSKLNYNELKMMNSSVSSEFVDNNFDYKSSTPANQLHKFSSVSSTQSKTFSHKVTESSKQTVENNIECVDLAHKRELNSNSATVKNKPDTISSFDTNDQCSISSDLQEKLSKCDDASGQVLRQTNNSLFMEIPCDTSDISSKTHAFSKAAKKYSMLIVSDKHQKKLQKISPFKAKAKSKLHSLPKESVKNSSILPKSGLNVKREKPSKFMPRKLNLIKPRRTESVVYHRNPFASMNIYYDEHWIEKQEAAFTSWLNFILTPNDFSSEDVKVDSAKLWIESIKETSSVPAPTKEELSLKAYTAARNLNMLRKSSFSLYQSEEIVAVIKKIEKEVDLKRLSIRKDRAIHADLGIKKSILEMLLSYNTLWLRIGLETVYGEVLTLQTNSDVIGLSRFIIHRFLNNPEISSKFMHPAVINYYKKGYEDEIQRFTLKKFLLLVFYLDTAKNVHLIKHNPCLFNKNSKYKSSRDLLLAFSREYLSGEGDVTKHLRYLGYKVSYQQSALEEFDYSVRNIAADLRCGLRLGRVVELLLQDWTISQMLRINTLNRLTKIHNNDVILKALKNASIEIENNIEAKHITDGDREKTLDLLWQIIFKTQISKLINKDLLKKENAFLFSSLKLRADFAAFNALRNPNNVSGEHEFGIHDSKLYKENEILQLLFQWCQNVCSHYGVKVHNFTSSFSDGRALSLLLHHYHPNVLPYESIKTETSSSYFEEQLKMAESNESCPFFMQDGQNNAVTEKLLKNERDNLTLVFQKFQEVGHIPILSCPSDMSNTLPDEKVMVTLVSYINIRLMELSIEIRAARKILHAWRRYRLRKQQERLKMEIQAVMIIQQAWKNFLERKRKKKQNAAAIRIQCYWRMCSAKKELIRLKNKRKFEWLTQNAIVIQAAYRGYSARKELLKYHQAAIIIQTSYRRWLARRNFLLLKKSVAVVERYIMGKKERKIYLKLKVKVQAARIIQQTWKTYSLRKREKQTAAAVSIQCCWRMYSSKKELAMLKKKKFEWCTQNAIIIQAAYRGYSVRKHLWKCHKSATIIQASYRRWLARRKFLLLKGAVATFELYFIGKKERENYLNVKNKIRIIQQAWKKYLVRKKEKQNAAAVQIQSYWRMHSAKKELTRLKEERFEWLNQNAIVIQAAYRGYIARKYLMRCHKAAIVIQASYRKWIAKSNFLLLKKSVATVERFIIGKKERKKYLNLKTKIMIIQKAWRKYLVRKREAAAVKIQCYWRIHSARKELTRLKKEKFEWLTQNAIVIQAAYRGYSARKQILKCHRAATLFQTSYRRWRARNNFVMLKKAVATVELYVTGKMERKKFFDLKAKVKLLQKAWRDYMVRKKEKQNAAAVRIQCYWRRYYAIKKLNRLRKERLEWLTQNAIVIQAAYRGYCVRTQLLKQHKAAIVIQALYRRWFARKNFLILKETVATIERYIIGKMERTKYLDLKAKAKILQQAWKDYLVRKSVKQNAAAVRIQCCWRMYSAQKELNRLKQKKFEWLSQNAIIIQSAYRGYCARKQLLKQHKAAIVIQASHRRWFARKNYLLLKTSVATVERFVIGKKERAKYLDLQAKIRMLQCSWRKYLVQKKEKQNAAAVRIQCCWRMYSAQKELTALKKEKLEWLTHNTIVIQAAYRGYCVRKELLKQHKAATVIQASCRKWLARKNFLLLKNAVATVERYIIGKKERKEYLDFKTKTMIIQRTWKKYLIRKEEKQNAAAVKIQCCWRTFSAKQELYKLRKEKLEWLTKNAIVIQAAYRGYCTRKQLLIRHQAAVVIQASYKRWLARRNFLLLKKSVATVELYIIGKMQRKKYLDVKTKSMIIQRTWKKYLIRKEEKHNAAAIKIQCCWRTFSAKQELNKLRKEKLKWLTKNAIVIQAAYRGYCTRKQLLVRQQAAVVIQASYKRWLARRNFLLLKKSVATVELYIVGKMERKKYLDVKAKTTIIQRTWKKYLVRKEKKQNAAAIKIQCCWRIFSAKKEVYKLQKEKFEWLTRNAIVIQAAYRGYCARKRLFKCNQAAVVIQSSYKRLLARRNFLLLKKSVAIVELYVSGKMERKKYLDLKAKIRIIQQAWKKYLARKTQKRNAAAVRIQCCWRMYFAKKKLMKLKEERLQWLSQNAITIQAAYRGYCVRKQLLKYKEAAIVIQAYYKRWFARKNFVLLKKAVVTVERYISGKQERKKYLDLKMKMKIIQRAWKKYLVRKEEKQNAAAIKIQCCWRIFSAKKELYKLQKEKFEWLTRNAVVIQAAYRGYCARNQLLKCHQAAVVIQACYKRWLTRRNFLLLKKSVATVELCIIGKMERKKYLDLKAKIRIIQQAWKKYLVRKTEKRNAAAVRIQCCWRMYFAKKKLMKLQEEKLQWLSQNAIIIQAAYRGYCARKQQLKYQQAAIMIQTYYKRWFARKNFVLLKKAVVTVERYITGKQERKKYLDLKMKIRAARIIQQTWRKYMDMKREKEREQNAAAVRIQCCWRVYSATKQLTTLKKKNFDWLTQNAIVIQAAYRGHCTRKQLLKYHKAAVAIQASYRRWHTRKHFILLKKAVAIVELYIIGKKTRRKYVDLKAKIQAAKIIQQAWRTYLQKEIKKKQNAAAIKIQAYWRMHSAKKELNKLKNKKIERFNQNAIVIQAAYRGYTARKQLLKRHQAAIVIQALYRKWLAKKNFGLLKKAVATVEKFIIGKREREKYLDLKHLPKALFGPCWYVDLRKSIIIFQRCARSYLNKREKAATVIQSYFRMWQAKQHFKRFKAAAKIQACWRAYLVRRSITDQKVINARRKILAADASEAGKLKNRTSRSLDLLFKDTLLQNILSALQDLDVCTNLSPTCCERLVESGGMAILISLVRACNRSIPHMEIIKLTANILLNLAKYEKTVNSIWEEEDIVDTVMRLMIIYREKGTAIFTKCCTLLWIFCQDPTKAQIMKENSSFIEQIRSFHNLQTRKQSIEAKRLVAKAIATRSFNTSILPKTGNTSIMQKMSERDSLQIDPEWMLGKHRKREFKDPTIAVTMIMKSLNLRSKVAAGV